MARFIHFSCKSASFRSLPATKARHESRPKTNAPLPTAERLQRLFTTFCAQIDDGHHPNAVLLRIAPDDADARQSARHLEAQLVCHPPLPYPSPLTPERRTIALERTRTQHTDIPTNIQAASAHLDFITTGFLHSFDALTATPLKTMPPPSGAAPYVFPAAQVKATEPETTKLSKKVRLPRGIVQGVTPPPDPERWLKKSGRAGFGARRRKGGRGGGATQGSAANVLDAGRGAGGGGGGKAKRKKRK
ncbi:hypothetical protein B0H10DRAFT_2219705 [Mycena sp. CBHHK59/15]|nr:hypothetical protein B0H10DRAFT_2219705 [Mycena sp. CBHHK59/15]